MIDSLLSLTRLAAIAHRGGSKLRPENTLAAFDHARDLGVDALECDVHLAKDDEVVVIHDATLERTTDAKGRVSAYRAEELAGVDAGFHFGPAEGYPFRRRGYGVPRLDELFSRYPSVPLVIEVKGDEPRTAERVIAIVREHRAMDRVIIGAFSQAVIDTVRRLAPDLPTSASSREARSALTRSYFYLSPAPARFQVFQMPFHLRGRRMFGRGFVRAARRAGIPVQAWIVDEPDEMRRLIEWGVTGMISDRPDLARQVIDQFRILNSEL